MAGDGTVTAAGYGQTVITVTATWRGTTGGADLTEELPVRVNENASLKVEADEGDLLFDEIGSALKIKQYQEQKRELLPPA